MEKNKTGKYLKYAIGEILLVVIGILIAVQINSWNTSQTNKKEEIFYLKKLHQNLTQDTLLLGGRIRSLDEFLIKHDSLLDDIKNPKLETFSTPAMVVNLFNTFRFTPQTSTFDNLISTGKLELIRDQAMVDSLFVYYNHLNNTTAQQNASIDTYARSTIGPFMLEFDDVEFPEKKPFEYGKIPFFKNAIYIRKIQLGNLKIDYEYSYERARNLILFVNKLVKRND